MSCPVSPVLVRNALNGLRDMYDDSLSDPTLSSANIHVQLAFTIASIRSEYVFNSIKN